ncbi:hypothetical protein LCGC14_0469430 [marine sediment metagenome]|uniref:Uncharacterized protein n=1 Tax=marine sediment metagenome TaxID=412755 RepID=A0A0F9VLD0_9ZZZZ
MAVTTLSRAMWAVLLRQKGKQLLLQKKVKGALTELYIEEVNSAVDKAYYELNNLRNTVEKENLKKYIKHSNALEGDNG